MGGAQADLERHSGALGQFITKKLPLKQGDKFLLNDSLGPMHQLGLRTESDFLRFPVLYEGPSDGLQRYKLDASYVGLEKRMGDPAKATRKVLDEMKQSIGEKNIPDVVAFDYEPRSDLAIVKFFGEVKLWLSLDAFEGGIKRVIEEAKKRGVLFYLAIPHHPVYSREGFLVKKAVKWVKKNLDEAHKQQLRLFSYVTDLYGNFAEFTELKINDRNEVSK
ncbi:MAG: hypothetical protein AB1468_02745 [Candidatus Micrarchaeota archaeon]